ncbi:hypothetical protein MMC12_004739 [Toensbergia leucococca]|nr:hypothetical protein [Toensbergia leucococca]
MPSDDLKNYATSDTDFYTLLGITFETSQRDIDRAWRKTALKYHPDKVGNDPVAKEKFHLAQIGYDLLSDPSIKVLYDNARTARLQKKRQNELFEGKRRRMKEDLEAREKGFKHGRDEEEDDEELFQRKIRRLAEDGKRRRKEREDMLKKDLQKEADASNGTPERNAQSSFANHGNGASTPVSEIDRTVRVRWPREGLGESLNKERLVVLFSEFGKVENSFLLKDKKLRIGEKRQKKLIATGVIVFASVVGAHAAVEDVKKLHGAEWDIIDSVFWAANKEPELINGFQPHDDETGSTPSTPASNGNSTPHSSFLNMENQFSTPTPSPRLAGDGLRKAPSFSSFSSAAFSTPKSSPFGKGVGVDSPSLEEITMIRLKNAEKKRLAAEIEKMDEEAAAAEANQA